MSTSAGGQQSFTVSAKLGPAHGDGVPIVMLRPPEPWTLTEQGSDGAAYRHANGLRVIWSAAREADGRIWLHVSLSRADRMPTYRDLKHVKVAFIGNQRKAIMVIPEQREHVNLHPFCLHLFSCLEEDPLPDFTRGTGMI